MTCRKSQHFWFRWSMQGCIAGTGEQGVKLESSGIRDHSPNWLGSLSHHSLPLSSSSMQRRLREDLVYNLGWILGNFLNWADPKPFQNLNFVKKSAIIFFDEINLEPPIHFGTPKEKIRSWELYDHGSELLWHLRSNFGLKCSKLCHPFFYPQYGISKFTASNDCP